MAKKKSSSKSTGSAQRASPKAAAEVCSSCCGGKWFGWLVLVAGVLWLLNDYGSAAFWKVNWWTLGALLVGLGWVMKK